MDFRNSSFQQACITSARSVVLENTSLVQGKVQRSYPLFILSYELPLYCGDMDLFEIFLYNSIPLMDKLNLNKKRRLPSITFR